MKDEKKFLDAMESDIMNADIPEVEKNKLMKNFLQLKEQKINLMITGATGCGKSSTINALFNTEVAKVGVGVDPETMDITRYDLDNLVLWDSPGLGDGKEADNRHAKNIIKKLNERDENGNLLIDLALVILDGSTRDLGTSYELINNVIIPNLGQDKENRILVAINQADMAMKGRYWDYENNRPEPPLQKFLEEKAESVRRRIREGTSVDVTPIYYSAGFKEEGMPQGRPYNLSKLLYYIIKFTPKEKRLSFVENINRNDEMWKDNDDLKDYRKGILEEFGETVSDCAMEGADIGGDIGSIFGSAGEAAGRAIGGVIGTGVGVVKAVWDNTVGKIFGGGGGGCYITTAICEEFGKADDCYELTAFRKFRDNWLKQQPDGEMLITRYYKTAPQIVDLINKQPNRTAIYQFINENYLSKCLLYIEKGENDKCKNAYIEMMEYLYREKEKWG
ncbi:MAG TPA: GTP-binding protein [Lachnospiraceae bacterium]|nr:GTP-binding protein [Lachnospiraceae bacterium]